MTQPLRPALLSAFALALSALPALAEPAPEPTAAPAATAAAAPETTVAPTAAEPTIPAATLAADLATMKAANPLPARDDAAIKVTVQTDGTRSAELDAGFLSTTVVRLGPDGQPIFGCVSTPEEYDAFFSASAEAAAPAAEVR